MVAPGSAERNLPQIFCGTLKSRNFQRNLIFQHHSWVRKATFLGWKTFRSGESLSSTAVLFIVAFRCMQRKTEQMLMYRTFFQHSNSQNSYLLSSETVYSQIFHIVLLGHLRPKHQQFFHRPPRHGPDSRNQTGLTPSGACCEACQADASCTDWSISKGSCYSAVMSARLGMSIWV
jgi:hypothetical protein